MRDGDALRGDDHVIDRARSVAAYRNAAIYVYSCYKAMPVLPVVVSVRLFVPACGASISRLRRSARLAPPALDLLLGASGAYILAPTALVSSRAFGARPTSSRLRRTARLSAHLAPPALDLLLGACGTSIPYGARLSSRFQRSTYFSRLADPATPITLSVEEFQESRLRSSVFARLYHVYAYSPNAHFCSGAFRKNFKVP